MVYQFKLHSKFRLNGNSYAINQLLELSSHYVTEGTSFEKSIGSFLKSWFNDSSTLEVRTSGSTGKPKSIFLEKKNMVNSALATGSYFELQAGDSALLCLSADFIAGKMMLVRALVLGLELDFVNPVSNVSDSILKEYDFCAMVPLQVEDSLNKLHFIKTLIVGGSPMSIELKRQVQKLPTQVFETYGMTETITHIAVKKVSLRSSGVGNIFQVLPNIEVFQDKRDCLVIHAPVIVDKPVVTNDVVKLHSNTSFEWLGRYDNIINSGGIKLIPEEIEKKLSAVTENRFFVAGVPDAKLGQKLILIIEGNVDKILLRSKIDKLKEFSKYEVPKNIYALDTFVESNGKIMRKEIIENLM